MMCFSKGDRYDSVVHFDDRYDERNNLLVL